MTDEKKIKFGEFVRQRRGAKKLGLREMARMVGVSPTYLSKIERDEFPPPAEDKITKIAEIIGCNPDELLALGGKLPADFVQWGQDHPRLMAKVIDGTRVEFSEDEAVEVAKSIAAAMIKRNLEQST